jgi:hypothetical protein
LAAAKRLLLSDLGRNTQMDTRSFVKSALQASVAIAGLAAISTTASANAPGTCPLANGIQHIVYLQFDNVELERDNPNVPSDLEQIPALLSFMKSNGTLLANHHTPLISHTADDIRGDADHDRYQRVGHSRALGAVHP